MYNTMKKTIATVLAIATLYSPIQAGEWYKVEPSVKQGTHAMRVEGGKGNVYGFADIEGKDVYAELRAKYDLTKKIGLVAEFNGSNSGKDTIRFGLTLSPKLGDFTLIKYFPVDTGDKGSQLSLYTEGREAGCKLSLLTDYNFKPGTLYGEARISKKIAKDMDAFIGKRFFGKTKDLESVTEFGLSCKF